MIILHENEQKTCIDYPLSLLGRGVGLLLTRSDVIGNEASENRKGFLSYKIVKNSQKYIYFAICPIVGNNILNEV